MTGPREPSSVATPNPPSAGPLTNARIATLWNSIAQAGGTLDETIFRFARLIEREVHRG